MATKAKRRRLISGLMRNSEMEIPESERFFVKSGNVDFSDRQTNIFSGLNELEAKHLKFQETMQPIENTDDENCDENDSLDDKFKVPIVPARRAVIGKGIKRSPDYILHPEKWIKYSLADVTDDQMSETSNYTVALSFLSERKRMTAEEEPEGTKDTERKIIFKSKALQNSDSSNEKSVFQSGKWVMPEYVVGKGAKAIKPFKTSTENSSSTSKAIELPHLNQDESDHQRDDVEEKAAEGKELNDVEEKAAEGKELKDTLQQVIDVEMDTDEIGTETSKFKAYNRGKRFFKKREEAD